MIVQIIRLTRWEWFKFSRRWMPWIILAIAVVFTQAILWGGYLAYHSELVQNVFGSSSSYNFSYSTANGEGGTESTEGETIFVHLSCDDVAGDRIPPEALAIPNEERRRDVIENIEEFRASCAESQVNAPFREGFVLPSSITGSLGAGHQIGVILILIVAASITGAEYGWGSLRMVLTRGVGRWQVLASKFLLLILAGAAGLVIIAVLAAVASLLAAAIPPSEAGGLFDSGSWADAGAMFGKAVYGLAPYAALGTFLAVLTSSPSLGVSFSLGYYFVELIAAPLLGIIPSTEKIPDYLIGQNVGTWMSEAATVSAEVQGGGMPSGFLGGEPGMLHAFFVMLAYILALGGASFWLFLRRDITGAKGA